MAFFAGRLNREHFIEANKQICRQTNETFGLDGKEDLDRIITRIQRFDNISDEKERIVKKIATILGGLGYFQPFKNGNKRTALSISVLFLRVNGFDLPYGDKENKKAIFEILKNSMFKFEGDDIYREVEGFLRKRIVKTQSK
ncbi:MAG: Fic family protein [Nitrosopumilaceae archaeon]